MFGPASITYANDDEWDQRQKCLFKTLKGDELKTHFPTFVAIAEVAKCVDLAMYNSIAVL